MGSLNGCPTIASFAMTNRKVILKYLYYKALVMFIFEP